MSQELKWVHGNLLNLINEARHCESEEAERLLLLFAGITSIAIEAEKSGDTNT